LLPRGPYPLSLGRGNARALFLRAGPEGPLSGEEGPLPADPWVILNYPREAWRDPRCEVFRWDRFPEILIFDTASYGVQDRFFKRLAFFVEKAGFRGRLAQDREIAALHGWNAHDYRAEALAEFFELARRSSFPLLPEERELEGLLLKAGLLRLEGGEIRSGKGALLSISRESPAYLRNRFMVHEGFHGLYFTDREFRDWSRRRWENFPPGPRDFIRAVFESQSYDTEDGDLMVNEFMAYLLQQGLPEAPAYFGEALAGRIAASWRRGVLPPGRGPYWPELGRAFGDEAAAFSAYAEERWGLSAGRVWRVLSPGGRP
jgi:hypothetical protein